MKADKKKKPLWILLGVFILLLAVYVGIGTWNDIKSEQEQKQQEAGQIKVTEMSGLQSISYKSDSQEMAFEKEEDIWYYAKDKTFPLNQNYVKTMENEFGSMVATRGLENSDELADYGLEEPAYTIQLMDAEGNETNLYIGDAVGEDYYLTLDDQEKVYTVGSSVVSAMMYDLDDMIQFEEFPSIGSGNLKQVVITEGQKETVYNADMSDDSEAIAGIAGGLGAVSFAACENYNVTETELAEYGLDGEHRITVEVTYTDEEEAEAVLTMYIGNTDASETYRYVLVDGSKMVNEVTVEIINNILSIEEETEE